MADPIRFDRFKPGDHVTWYADFYAELTRGREKYGDGPFTIVSVELASPSRHETPTQHRWEAMGHTQYVTIDGHANKYSGAFFRKVKP